MSDLSAFFGQAAFDTNSVEAQGDYEVLPAGKYLVLVEKAEVRPTKANTGHYIYLEMKILDGKFKGMKVFDRINIDNPNQKCVEIGQRCLAALGKAVGLQAVSDTNQLLNKTVTTHVKVKNEQNEVRTYSAATAYTAPVAPMTAPVAPAYVTASAPMAVPPPNTALAAPAAAGPPVAAPAAPKVPGNSPYGPVAPAPAAGHVAPAGGQAPALAPWQQPQV